MTEEFKKGLATGLAIGGVTGGGGGNHIWVGAFRPLEPLLIFAGAEIYNPIIVKEEVIAMQTSTLFEGTQIQPTIINS